MATAASTLTTASAQVTQANTALASAQNIPSDLQAQWASAQSAATSGQTEDAGVSAMGRIVSKGSFDPNNPEDMQGAIDIISGALCACGLPMIGAAVELLDAGAHALAPVLEKLGIVSVGTGWSTGGKVWTTADVLAAWQWPAPATLGIVAGPKPVPFALVAIPVFAKYAADAINGGSTPPNSLILDALVKAWNKQGGSTPQVQSFAPGWLRTGLAGIAVPGVAGPDVLPVSAPFMSTAISWGREMAYAFAPAATLPQPWTTSGDPWAGWVSLSTHAPVSTAAAVAGDVTAHTLAGAVAAAYAQADSESLDAEVNASLNKKATPAQVLAAYAQAAAETPPPPAATLLGLPRGAVVVGGGALAVLAAWHYWERS